MAKQLVYIDESGDPGLAEGSSDFFSMAAVVLDYDENFALENKMQEMRRLLGWSPEREFKFNRTKKDILYKLVRSISSIDYNVEVVILNKAKFRQPGYTRHEVYRYALTELLRRIDLANSKIVLDGLAGKKFKKNLLVYLRREVSNISKRNFRMEDSKKSDGVQLADVIIGTFNGSLSQRRDAKEIWSLIRKRSNVTKI